jgi:YhcH/YjgK/YiaL family protein
LGTYELEGPTLHASVQEYTTQERQSCRLESHREHIDIQYTIAGFETIDWIPREALSPEGPFGNDVQFWFPATDYTPITQSVGRFSIFFPSDAHRPKVIHGQPTLIRKVVIKIPVHRVG